LKTSIGTTAYLIAMLVAVALVPVPQKSKEEGSCLGSVSNYLRLLSSEEFPVIARYPK